MLEALKNILHRLELRPRHALAIFVEGRVVIKTNSEALVKSLEARDLVDQESVLLGMVVLKVVPPGLLIFGGHESDTEPRNE